MGFEEDAEKVVAAEGFEKILFMAAPFAKKLIDFIDVASDGHLIVNVKASFLDLKNDHRDKVCNAILKLWRDTKYVREQGWGNWATVKYWDTKRLKEISMEFGKEK